MWYSKIKTVGIVILSAMIILVLLTLVVDAARMLVQELLPNSQNNDVVLDEAPYHCQQFARRDSKRMYIIRLDDVQAFTWSDVNERLITDALDRGFPVVAGIIPKNLNDDTELKYFLRKHSCNIEMALHGWDHGLSTTSMAEFEAITKDEALQRINQGITVLNSLTDEQIVTFIPPQNLISDAAQEALTEKGFRVTSSEGENQYDYSATMWDFELDSFVTFSEVVRSCNTTFLTKNLCVIMVHPQDFLNEDQQTINSDKYQEFVKLIDYFSAINADVVTFSYLLQN